MVVTQALQRPQPGSPSETHCSAAAKHTAATDLPDPGGPVINHACVIVPDADTL
jgi:adenylate cyclase